VRSDPPVKTNASGEDCPYVEAEAVPQTVQIQSWSDLEVNRLLSFLEDMRTRIQGELSLGPRKSLVDYLMYAVEPAAFLSYVRTCRFSIGASHWDGNQRVGVQLMCSTIVVFPRAPQLSKRLFPKIVMFFVGYTPQRTKCWFLRGGVLGRV